MNWITRVTEANSENEAPEKFFYWSAMAAISAVVRKNVYLDRFYYKLYPNIYVFIIAQSGMKKGIPINLAKTLVTKANATRVISGRNSMPHIIKDLGKAESIEGGGIIKDAHGFLVTGELASFLVKDPDALNVLTDLHNTHEHEERWKNSLKGTGIDILKSPCLTLLGASNEDLLGDVITQKDITGGFIARTFMVMTADRGILNSLVERPTKVVNTDDLSLYLKDLVNIKGEFQWTLESKKMYKDWYHDIMSTTTKDPTNTLNRIGDKALKAAMLISLGESKDLILEARHIYEGITVTVECYSNAKQVTMGAGKSNLAAQTKTVLRELIRHPEHKISRKKILQMYWGDFDSFDLDRIIETLIAADAIQVLCPGTDKAVLILKENVLDQYVNFKKGIQ